MDAEKTHQKVVVIRLPANYQRANLPNASVSPGGGPQTMDINQIPDEVIAEMVSSSYRQDPASLNTIQEGGINANIMIDNSDPKQMELYSIDHPQLAPSDSGQANNRQTPTNLNTYTRTPSGNPHNTTNNLVPNNSGGNNNNNNNAISAPTTSEVQKTGMSLLANSNSKPEDESIRNQSNQSEEGIQYKNYTPKQREWMLVVLAYSRGLLGKPFESKLQDTVIEKAREVLKKESAIFKLTDRIPTPKTLRGVWKNLWIHPDRTVGTVKKGGRPRIDPELKKRKRNEREKRRRAIMRQQKEMEAGKTVHQSPITLPRRSQRGQ